MRKNVAKFLLLASAAYLASPAIAQQAQPNAAASSSDKDFGDIVVTAQKRSESVQKVPLAITALSGKTLADRNITDVGGLAKSVPNMTFGSYGGAARIAIRGVGYDDIGEGEEGRVAYHLDGVYVSRPSAILGTFYDVERVEVLRGPQGTLYGRNATAGAINVIPKAPTDHWEGNIEVGYGNYNALTSEGALGGPIAPGVRFRVAYTVEDHDGYGKNVVTGHHIDDADRVGTRGTLSFDLGPSGKLDLSGDYYREKDRDYGSHYLGAGSPAVTPTGLLNGGFVPTNPRDIAEAFDPVNNRNSYGFSAHAQFDLGGGVTLKSISAYRHSYFSLITTLSGTSDEAGIVNYAERARQLSQEFQISGNTGRLKYIAGAYYFNEHIDAEDFIPVNLDLFGSSLSKLVQGDQVTGNMRTQAAAAFGQLDYDVSDNLTLTIGGRYSWEKHEITDRTAFNLTVPYPPRTDVTTLLRPWTSTKNSAFTPKFELDYKPIKDVMFYALASEGFKSGGFEFASDVPAFKPEKLWDYEAGMKGTFAGGRLRVNLSGFYYDYSNLQVSKVVDEQVVIENAASSVIYGAEAELTFNPVRGLQFDATPAWLHSKYKNFTTANPGSSNPNPVNLDGNQITQAPKYSLKLGGEYKWSFGSGQITVRGEMNYQDRIYFTPFDEKAASRSPNTKFNTFLNYGSAHWNVSIYCVNLTDKTTIANAVVASSLVGFPVLGTLEPPRTFGVKIGYRF